MKRFSSKRGKILVAAFVILVSVVVLHPARVALGATAEENKTPSGAKPSEGWTLHIDAKMHLPSKPDLIAHHYCKTVAKGMTQCQLYDSDNPDAHLIGVEVIVGPETYNQFDAKEKRFWHYHKTEIPLVEAKLPDLSSEEAANVVKGIEETYGKIYVLWDPGKNDLPVGRPSVTILQHGAKGAKKQKASQ